VADSRNAFRLLAGNRGKQGAGTAEKNLLQLFLLQFFQQISAEHHSAAPTSGAACMDVLPLRIKDHHTAVGAYTADADTVFSEEIHQNLHA